MRRFKKIIEIKKDVRIGNIILEKGDKILINEDYQFNYDQVLKHVDYDEGIVNFIGEIIRYINNGTDPQTAFSKACQNNNYCGDRPDIFKSKNIVISALKNLYNININNTF